MEYSVRLHPRVLSQIAGWGLSTEMLVEVRMRLREELGQSPLYYLRRDPDGPGGRYPIESRDPGDPDFQQIFMFRVFFDEDEKQLHVVHGSYWRNYDPQR